MALHSTDGLLAFIFLLFVVCATATVEKRLIRHLLEKYDALGTYGRPVDKVSDPMNVYFGMSLIQIMDIDEKNQVLTTNVWVNYRWNDLILTWNTSDYDNITSVRVPSDKIWTPDVKLYNYADSRLSELREALVVVYSDGSILWVPQAIYMSSCRIDIADFPFDHQTCTMKFGSWTYNGFFVDLFFFFSNNTGLDFTDYLSSNEWDIVSNSSRKNIKYYQCCPEPYIDLTFKFVLRRKVAFYNYILILPCVLLSSLTLVLFWLPPESPAKMQLGMNIFVAFFVLLLLLAESTPPAASSIPLIGAYYCLNMVLITFSTCLSVIVVNIYFHGSHSRVPATMKKVMIEYVAPALCMRKLVVTMSKVQPAKTHMRSTIYTSDQTRSEGTVLQAEEHKRLIPNGSVLARSGSKSTDCEGHDYNVDGAERLECDVRDIKMQLHRLTEKIATKESKQFIDTEWKIIAIIVDRIFFIFYLTCIVVSGFAIFWKTKSDYNAMGHAE